MVDTEHNQTEVKLTKKQKKALQFREAKKNKQKSKDSENGESGDRDNTTELDAVNEPTTTDTSKDKLKLKNNKKNLKQDSSKVDKTDNKNSKKRKAPSGENTSEPSKDQATGKPTSGEKDKKTRYIVFVGNLSYNASEDDIQKHFLSCGNPSVRLSRDKSTNNSKGFAFVEFENSVSLSKALHLHQSTLNNRKINVEVTAGGGGASDQRKKKIADRNAKLNKEREKFEKKNNGHSKNTKDDDTIDSQSGHMVNPERLKMIKNLGRKSKR